MGGQGGGVLTDWIVRWPKRRAGSRSDGPRRRATHGRDALLCGDDAAARRPEADPSLMPTPGDVDVVMAAEFMEAGRSILRGLVTPDKTGADRLEPSLLRRRGKDDARRRHRRQERGERGDRVAAKKEIVFDMDALALREGSVISATMFGALAASGALPFPSMRFGPSSRRAAAARRRASLHSTPHSNVRRTLRKRKPSVENRPWRVNQAAPVPTRCCGVSKAKFRRRRDMARVGLRESRGLSGCLPMAANISIFWRKRPLSDSGSGGARTASPSRSRRPGTSPTPWPMTTLSASPTARRDRRARAHRAEVGLGDAQVLRPPNSSIRAPKKSSACCRSGWRGPSMRAPAYFGWIDRRFNKGRRIRTYSLSGFLSLYAVSGLRGLRRRSLRHAVEVAHRDEWALRAEAAVAKNYQLGVET